MWDTSFESGSVFIIAGGGDVSGNHWNQSSLQSLCLYYYMHYAICQQYIGNKSIDINIYNWYKSNVNIGGGSVANDNSQSSFRRGMMSLVILSLLQHEDMYGYQLVQQIEERSGGRIVTQEGSLYPVLYKLLDLGFISDRKVKVGKRMNRIYYHLEPTGEKRLGELTREYEEISRGVFMIIKGSGDCEQ